MRPPEGYCGTCHYMIELTEDGRLPCHGSRTLYGNFGTVTGRSEPCGGTGTFPVPPPGDEDPTVAFSSEERAGRCPVCKSTKAIEKETNGRMYMIWHQAPIISQDLPGTVCPGTYDTIEYV